jgi:hypothetical protein
MNQKYKYTFSEHIGPNAKAMPEDANGAIRKYIAPLHCDILENTINKAEKTRAYGDIYVYDAKNALICKMELQSGIVKTFQMMDDPEKNHIYAPLRVLYLKSYRNNLWSFRKEKPQAQEDTHAEAV